MKKLWFKRKRYGWGWYPVTWQGWLVVLIYILCLLVAVLDLKNTQNAGEVVFSHIVPIVFLTIMLIIICYKKGEKPRWQWGGSPRGGDEGKE